MNNYLQLLKDKQYFQEGESKWEHIASRVSKAIASAEKDGKKRDEVEKEIYDALSSMTFIFSTPVLLNANETKGGQLSSCFINSVKDTIESICEMDAEFAKIFQKNGGAGADLSALRPSLSTVGSSKGYAGGVVTFMEKYDATADTMTRNNPSRKGALKFNLQVWHPQILDFISCKSDTKVLQRTNISVSLNDKFMNAVENDEQWELVFPDYLVDIEKYDKEWDGDIDKWISNGGKVKVYQTIPAKDILLRIAENAHATGEPGINFQDTMNRGNPNKHLATMVATNPCSEFSNIPYSSCNLGSINITRFVHGSIFEYDELLAFTKKAVRWFDNMISVNKLPLKKIDETTKAIRPIGIGYMGIADAMYMLGIKYNSPEGTDFIGRVTKTMKDGAIEGAMELAKERGTYPAYKGSEWEKAKMPIRNSSLLSIAPTGTIAFIAGVSGGIEPNYALVYTRRTAEGTTYNVTNPIFKMALEREGIWSEELAERIAKNNGSCQGIQSIPKEIQDVFVVASDISAQEHIDAVSIAQNYVDLSISKTVNYANNAKIKDIYQIIVMAWQKGIKGFTVYRDGSRQNQTLSTSSTYKEDEKPAEEPTIIYDTIDPPSKEDIGETYGSNIKKQVACGSLFINLCRDENGNLVEAFINTGKGGICQSNINALSRMVSLALRSGVKVDAIVDQLGNIKCPACTILNSQGKKVERSCPDAVAKYLKEKYEAGNVVIRETKAKKKMPVILPSMYPQKKEEVLCPNCKEPMRMEAGCTICTCGFSKCG